MFNWFKKDKKVEQTILALSFYKNPSDSYHLIREDKHGFIPRFIVGKMSGEVLFIGSHADAMDFYLSMNETVITQMKDESGFYPR